MTVVRYFVYVVAGGLIASALGGGFGWLVGQISPDFVRSIFIMRVPDQDPVAYATAVGMVNGLFLGIGVVLFSLLLVTAVQIASMFLKKRDE